MNHDCGRSIFAVTTLHWEHYAQDARIREQTYEEIRNNMVKFQE